jgi:4-azaleucine resistance transporter AzlC
MSTASFSAEVQRGARTFLPVALSIAAYGVVWGVLAGQAKLSLGEVLAMSTLVFAGASQFVALTMWTPEHLPILSIIVAAAIVNLRMTLMSATLGPVVRDVTGGRALAAMFFVGDEQWAVTMGEVHRGRGTMGFFIGAGVLSWIAWVGATVAGRLLGAVVAEPAALGLDFAFTATFIALLLGMWKGRADLVPWLVAGAVAIACARLLPGNWYIIVGGLAGSLAGALGGRPGEAGDVA